MKSAHNPSPPVELILILVGVAFLTGIIRAFRSAGAAAPAPAKITINNQAVATTSVTPTPVPTEADIDLPAQPTPTVVPVSADTSGIIALAFVIVATILVGASWGSRKSPPKKIPR